MQRLGQVLKAALSLFLIGLILPGGGLVVLGLLARGSAVADLLPGKVAAFLPFPKALEVR